jgi:hypothetical protein
VDLNRQALLVLLLATLVPAAVGHAADPAGLVRAVGRQAVLPGASERPRVAAGYAGSLIAAELAVVAAGLAALTGTGIRLAGLALAACGLGFVGYLVALLAGRYSGDCACSPLPSGVTPLSLVPGTVLAAGGLVLALDRPLADVGLDRTSGALQTGLALAAAGLLGALLVLLPASALRGDPRDLSPEEG